MLGRGRSHTWPESEGRLVNCLPMIKTSDLGGRVSKVVLERTTQDGAVPVAYSNSHVVGTVNAMMQNRTLPVEARARTWGIRLQLLSGHLRVHRQRGSSQTVASSSATIVWTRSSRQDALTLTSCILAAAAGFEGKIGGYNGAHNLRQRGLCGDCDCLFLIHAYR